MEDDNTREVFLFGSIEDLPPEYAKPLTGEKTTIEFDFYEKDIFRGMSKGFHKAVMIPLIIILAVVMVLYIGKVKSGYVLGSYDGPSMAVFGVIFCLLASLEFFLIYRVYKKFTEKDLVAEPPPCFYGLYWFSDALVFFDEGDIVSFVPSESIVRGWRLKVHYPGENTGINLFPYVINYEHEDIVYNFSIGMPLKDQVFYGDRLEEWGIEFTEHEDPDDYILGEDYENDFDII